ncbi:Retinoic acid receptor alpha [Anabarilius grahami]|uniref:Retinoic acid receptor alpha n=1 Tax=Anabarilius grahami TaxID=495550 RepID=A0A3N0Y161_ANAGA|nr:Retinoic acid receptor alpha [Anabarilius grahami]
MSGKGNPSPHLNGFPMAHYSYFFPHMLGGLSPPSLPTLSLSGYSTPSPASLCLDSSDLVSTTTLQLGVPFTIDIHI